MSTTSSKASPSNELPAIETEDYIELFLRHLVRCPEVMEKAKRFKLVGSDLIIADVYGDENYKAFVNAAMAIGTCPIDKDTYKANLKKTSDIEEKDRPDVQRLFNFLYDKSATLTPSYFTDTLKRWITKKRWDNVVQLHRDNPTDLWDAWKPIATGLAIDDYESQAVHVSPFETLLIKPHENTITTGVHKLDEAGCGLNYGEYGLIIGFTGGGKTALGVNIILNNALGGRNAQFISLEETEDDIAQRFYSNVFDISYSELHKGTANQALEAEFRDQANADRIATLRQYLRLTGMKGMQGATPGTVYQAMLRNFEDSGFIPHVVVIDQMQFLTPESYNNKMEGWEKEKTVNEELDALSHKTINGQKFCLWVLHQAKGNRKRRFKEEDIGGYKGIIQPTDMSLGIGRDKTADECTIFTLKARHGKEFEVDVPTTLQYMRFPRSQPQAGPRPLPDDVPGVAAVELRRNSRGEIVGRPPAPLTSRAPQANP